MNLVAISSRPSTDIQHKRCNTKQYDAIREAVHILREYVEEPNAEIAELINDKILTHFKSICFELQKYPKIQLDVLWIIINISLKHKYTNKIFDDAFIPIYLQLLQSQSYALKHHVLWILGIASGESMELRNNIMYHTLDDISSIIESEFDKKQCTDYGELPHEYDKLMAISAFVLYTFCEKGHHSHHNKYKLLQMIQCLLRKYGANYKVTFNLSNDDIIEIRSQIVWSIFALIMHHNEDKEFLKLLSNQSIIKELIYFLSSNNDHIIEGSVRTFGSILKHNTLMDKYVFICIECGLLKSIKLCMNRYKELASLSDSQSIIMEEMCCLISKVSADSLKSVESLKTNDLLMDCIGLVLNNEDIDIGKQALIAVTNAVVHCDEDMISYLVNNGYIDAVFDYVSYHNLDVADESIRYILDSLECIFMDKANGKKYAQKFANIGGIPFLRQIKECVDDGVFTLNEWKASNLIKHYFEVNKENDDWYAFDMKYIATQ